MSEITIDARTTDKIGDLTSGIRQTITVKTKLSFSVIEMEDVNFHFDSAVLLPDYGKEAPQPGTAEQNRITGLGVIFSCYKLCQDKSFAQRILVVGHTDKKGSSDYNLKLSRQRAENVFAALAGKKTEWAIISDKKHQVEDYKQILKWISFNWGWDCDPGEVNNEKDSNTSEALKKFQVRYNKEFEEQIPETGNIEIKTWGAFFDVYMEELAIIMGITREGLEEIQSKLQFVEKPAPSPAPKVGCGENFPASKSKTESENPADRRVEILFFDEGEEPLLKCHPNQTTCISSKCDLYGTELFERKPVPAEPLPVPSGEAARVFLQLFYKDPEANNKTFPGDFPVTVEFPDGTIQNESTAKDGKLKFLVEREKKSFTLNFETSNDIFFSKPKDSDETKSVFEPEVPDLQKNGNKIFKLPLKWSLKNSKWVVSKSDDFKDPDFVNIEQKKKNIGSEGGFVEMVLEPKWQFIRVEFFDRVFGHSNHDHLRICIPPVIIDGFNKEPTTAGEKPDTRSSWIVKEDSIKDTVLCLPWIIQKSSDGKDQSKPDTKMFLRIKTEPDTYIVSEDAKTRKIDKITDKSKLVPGPDRMKFYDLPELWTSKKYFTRFKGQDGKLFEAVTQGDIDKSLQADTPLIFSLDDIILTGKDLKQHKIKDTEAVAVFYHQFLNPNIGTGKPISDQGIYNPGTDASKDVYPFSDIKLLNGCYLNDYPDWTRLVIAEGNIFEIFDKRTSAGGGNDVTGARAAVMWVDAVSLGVKPNTTMSKRPGRFSSDADPTKSFFSIQPFFSQDIYPTRSSDLAAGQYKEFEKPVPNSFGFLIGRFDKALIRCCDVKDGTEIAKVMSYFRFVYNLAGAPAKNKDGTPFNAAVYEKKMVENLPKRWNGPDGGNPGTFEIKPQDENKLKIKVQPYFFIQKSIFNRAHFQINVISIPRANMNGDNGIGNFSIGNEEPDSSHSFIAAHECGHGASLPDEYNERWSRDSCSYQFLGFGTNTPGDPFSLIPQSSSHSPLMYEGTTNIHSRYYWHSAEFVSKITGLPFNVEITRGTATRKYNLKSHLSAPQRNFSHFPLFVESNASVGSHSLFDLYLYQLGNDNYRYEFLGGKGCDGLLLVLVKIRYSIPEAVKHRHIVQTLASFRNAVASNMNNKFTYKGDLSGVHFDNLLVHFTPRFLVENLVVELTDPSNLDYLFQMGYTLTPALPAHPTSTNATQSDYISHVNNIENFHPRHFLTKIGKNLTTGWSGAHELHIKLDVTTSGNNLGSVMLPFFGDMTGLTLSGSKTPSSDNIKNIIVKRAVPGVK